MNADGFLGGATAWLYAGAVPPVCPTCGFSWSTPAGDAVAHISASPDRYAALLAGRDGMAQASDGGWNATSFVWHLADLARGWSERWVVLAGSPGALLAGWDPDELADARNYRAMPTVSALWALRQCTEVFVELTGSLDPTTPFLHADWGTGTVAEALIWLGHEFVHHEGDVIERAGPTAAREIERLSPGLSS